MNEWEKDRNGGDTLGILYQELGGRKFYNIDNLTFL